MDKTPLPSAEDSAPGVSLRDMRRNGLTYKKGSGHLPGIPAQSMDGPTAAAYIPDRATLDAVIGTGWYTLADPPKADKPTPPPTPPVAPDKEIV